MCIDSDARHMSGAQVLGAWLAGLGFFAFTYFLVHLSNPAERSPVAPKSTVLDAKRMLIDVGLADDDEEEH